MTLAKWDEQTAPNLQRIEQCATWLAYYADQIHAAASVLPGMPPWKTKAEDALEGAEEKLRKAKEVISGKRRETPGPID